MPASMNQRLITDLLLPVHFQNNPGLKEKIEALHRVHVATCERIGAPSESFRIFALEIVNAPADAQAKLLTPIPPEQYEPTIQYRQYETPHGDEWRKDW